MVPGTGAFKLNYSHRRGPVGLSVMKTIVALILRMALRIDLGVHANPRRSSQSGTSGRNAAPSLIFSEKRY